MQDLILVGASFFLCGGLLGWLVGHSAGFVEGIEHEKQRLVQGALPEKKL
jgi:hypothetical protein